MASIYKVFLKEVTHINGQDVDINSYVGQKGELFFDPDLKKLKISDGTTPGGVSLDQDDISVRNITGVGATFTGALTGTTATFSGNVGVGGTLTYEDVKNVDSVGIITANAGIRVSGIVTAVVGTAVTYYGDGSNLEGVSSANAIGMSYLLH